MFSVVAEYEGVRYAIALWPAVFLVASLLAAVALAPPLSRHRNGLLPGLLVAVGIGVLALLVPLVAWLAWPEADVETGVGVNVSEGRLPWLLVQIAVMLIVALVIAAAVILGRIRDQPTSTPPKPLLLLISPLLILPAMVQNASLVASRYAPLLTPDVAAYGLDSDGADVSPQLSGRRARLLWFPGWVADVDAAHTGRSDVTIAAYTPFARLERDVEVHVGANRGDAGMPIREGSQWHYHCQGRSGRRVFGLGLAGAVFDRVVRVEGCDDDHGLTVCEVSVESSEGREPSLEHYRVFGVGGTTRVSAPSGSVPLIDEGRFALMPGDCAPPGPPPGGGPSAATSCREVRQAGGARRRTLFGSDTHARSVTCELESAVEGPPEARGIPVQ